MGITKKQAKEAKKAILKYLTEDMDKPHNQAIFMLENGGQCFNGTDLEMVMDKVVSGLWSIIEEDK